MGTSGAGNTLFLELDGSRVGIHIPIYSRKNSTVPSFNKEIFVIPCPYPLKGCKFSGNK